MRLPILGVPLFWDKPTIAADRYHSGGTMPSLKEGPIAKSERQPNR